MDMQRMLIGTMAALVLAACAAEADRKGAPSTSDGQAQIAKDIGYSGTGLPPRPSDGGGY